MSLTITQTPDLIHQIIYPEWYATTSTSYLNNNFKYKFQFNTTEGVIAESIIYPRHVGGYGYYDPNTFLKNIFGTDFQPEISTWTTCPNSIKQYRVDIIEVNGDADEELATKKVGIKNTMMDYNYNTNILTSNSHYFLSDIKNMRRKVDLTNSMGTVRFLSGTFISNITPIQYLISYGFQILLNRTRNGVTRQYLYIIANPYWNDTVTVGMNTDNEVIEDVSKWMLEFPACPSRLNALSWNQLGTPLVATNILKNGDLYSLQLYSTFARSAEMKFEVDDCYKNSIQVYWESYNGGFDFLNFSKVYSKAVDIKKNVYERQRDSVKEDNKFYINMTHNEYSRGTKQFGSTTKEIWTLNTDWMTDLEFLEIESLFSSGEVYIRMKNSTGKYSYYPVLLLTDKTEISTNRKGLRNVQIEVEISNKKYN